MNFVKEGNLTGVTFTNMYNTLLFDDCMERSVSADSECLLVFLGEIKLITRCLDLMSCLVN